jgi:acyl dehydratase
VALGDTIHASGRIDRLDEVNALTGIVGVRLDVLNQRDRVVTRAGIEVLWRRGSGVFPGIEEPFELAGLPI